MQNPIKKNYRKGLSLVFLSGWVLTGHAGSTFEQEVWGHLSTIYNHIRALQARAAVPGPQGERGLPGPQGPRGESADASPYKAGKGIAIDDHVISITLASPQIGDVYQGGIVFWVDGSGQHGLVVSKQDLNQGRGIQWRNGASGNKITNARADGIGAGDANTKLIIASQTIDDQSGQFAALMASNYAVLEDGESSCGSSSNIPCYGGWYLPSRYELQLLANAQSNGLAFTPDYYWSSTESSVTQAWVLNVSNGEMVASDKADTLGRVRAVRSF